MARQAKIPYQENYDFGIGVDSVSGSPMGKVITGEISGVKGALGDKARFDIFRVHNTSELEQSLDISAEASYGIGLFSVSARFDFAKKAKVQQDSLFMAITASVTLEYQSIDDPTLTPQAAEIVNLPDLFSRRYGNMFVRGVGRGGLFVGVIQINTSSAEESQSIVGKLKGSYGLFSMEGKTKFDEVRRETNAEIHITVYHEGGPIDLHMKDITNPVELYEMFTAWLKSFKDDPEQNAIPYNVTLAPIEIANGPIPPNSVDIQHAQDVIMFCAKERSRILDNLNLMEYIQRNTSLTFQVRRS
jgi:hypothetical protein